MCGYIFHLDFSFHSDLFYVSEMEETGFSYGGYLIFNIENIMRRTPRSQTTSADIMEQCGPRLRTMWSISEVGIRWQLIQISSVFQALSL